MALQGTLETFALPDVLQLLASTKKTGRLRLSGDRGSGSVWLDAGEIVAGEASVSPLASEAVEVVFELLRFGEGDFVFEADEASAEPGPAVTVDDALAGAETMLVDWAAIEAVVPSTAALVTLRGELESDEVTIDRERWLQLVAIGGGRTVSDLGEYLGLSGMAASRVVKDLVEVGVVELGEAPPEAPAAPMSVQADSDAPLLTVVGDAARSTGGFAESPGFETPSFEKCADDTSGFDATDFASAGFDGSDAFEPAGSTAAVDEHPRSGEERFDMGALVIEDTDAPAAFNPPEHLEPAPVAIVPEVDEPTDAAEIARQLANLSPKAAKAVAAAAKATTQEEREAALADVDDEEEPINRGLLLKFLGSVNG